MLLELANPNYTAVDTGPGLSEQRAAGSKLAALLTNWPAGAPSITVQELTDALLAALTPAQRAALLAKQPRRGLGVLVRRLLREAGHEIDT
jgi:hypothetical protein